MTVLGSNAGIGKGGDGDEAVLSITDSSLLGVDVLKLLFGGKGICLNLYGHRNAGRTV